MEEKIDELESTIIDLSKRCKHYREAHNALKSKCEHLEARKTETDEARKRSEERCKQQVEEKDTLLNEAYKTLDEYKAQLKTAQQNYASVLAAYNTLQGEVRVMGARYERSLDDYATTYALIVSERDNLKKVNDALVAELRRRDRMGDE